MLIENNSKLVVIGDSISDFERARPVGEGLFESIGKSYIALIDSFLRTTYPESKIRVVNMGTSGDTVRDIKNRWDTDVLGLKPDWVAVLIGINDVWRQFDSPLITESHVYLDEYEKTLNSLVKDTAPKVTGLVLMTPFFMEPNRQDPMRAKMDEYGAVVKKIANQNHLICVDLQAAFDSYLQHYYSASITWDRIHPNPVGHMIIAKAFLNSVGFEWNKMGE
ncbi:MAG: family lipase [Caproiciproducens sp.]|nr:family lipase [Caproiciproducens sp.]